MKFKLFYILAIVTLHYSASADAARDNITCGINHGMPLSNAYGPYDLTNPAHAHQLPRVLNSHFTPIVERLIAGNRSTLLGDIDYTLRAIPNYHRALYSIAKYHRLHPKAKNKYYTAECYLKRAIYFQPRDEIAKMLYAMHLHMIGQHSESKALYQQALRIRPKGAELNYNYGLLLVEMELFPEAKSAAKIAYNKGYPMLGLKKKLANH